jgi:hypothetical protein
MKFPIPIIQIHTENSHTRCLNSPNASSPTPTKKIKPKAKFLKIHQEKDGKQKQRRISRPEI